jgi:hypothetical protein
LQIIYILLNFKSFSFQFIVWFVEIVSFVLILFVDLVREFFKGAFTGDWWSFVGISGFSSFEQCSVKNFLKELISALSSNIDENI